MSKEELTMDEAAASLEGMDLLGEGVEDEEEDEEDQVEASEDQAEDQDDDDESEDDESEEEPDDEDDPLFKLVLKDGDHEEEAELRLSELRKGYMRNRKFTQRMEEIAQQRRDYEARQAEAAEKIQRAEGYLAQWAVNTPQEPDWGAYLRQGYSAESVLAEQAKWQQQARQREQAKAQYQELLAERQQEAVATAEKQILQAFPSWTDREVAQREGQKILETAAEYGFDGQQLRQAILDDPRVVQVLHDAARYRSMKNKPAKLEKRTSPIGETLRPGAKTTAKQKVTQQQKKAQERFQRTGSIEDAAAALGDISGLF